MNTVQIVCPHCDYSKSVGREKIPAGTRSITCPKCQQRFEFAPDDDFSFAGDGAASAESPRSLSKVALLVLTFFLGGVGGHKFYLRKYLQGLIYLLFFWTGIPSLVALVEFILYAFKSETELQRTYL
ncbi:MAG: hypothetical protein C0623_05510 [Desulfuromonas sp.]|nr:MAG: hypothetical protein C0623_05510 [Desulfuromonas sp.]